MNCGGDSCEKKEETRSGREVTQASLWDGYKQTVHIKGDNSKAAVNDTKMKLTAAFSSATIKTPKRR